MTDTTPGKPGEPDPRTDIDGDAEQSQPTTHSRRGRRRRPRKEYPWYVEIPAVVVATVLVIALLQTFVGRLYVIPSQSMEPTLHGCSGCFGDRIFVDKLTYDFSKPQAGDVVVFKGPKSWNDHFTTHRSTNPLVRGIQDLGSAIGIVSPDENDLVKRIIATGGQTVSCQAGDPGIMVDGKPIDSSYTLNPPTYIVADGADGSDACGGPYFGPVTVPKGNVWVMGDNRTNSADSRYHMSDSLEGTVPEKNIIGKVQAIVWPPSRMGLVGSRDIHHVD